MGLFAVPNFDEFSRLEESFFIYLIIFDRVTKCFREAHEEWSNEEVDTYMFASWCRFPFYEADFGWGKPSWVSRRDFGAELVSLMDTKCGSVIEAWVGLDEQHMF